MTLLNSQTNTTFSFSCGIPIVSNAETNSSTNNTSVGGTGGEGTGLGPNSLPVQSTEGYMEDSFGPITVYKDHIFNYYSICTTLDEILTDCDTQDTIVRELQSNPELVPRTVRILYQGNTLRTFCIINNKSIGEFGSRLVDYLYSLY